MRIARRNTSTNIIAEQHSKVTISLKFSNIIVTMNTHSTQTLGFEYFAAVAFIGEIKSKISPGVLARHIYIQEGVVIKPSILARQKKTHRLCFIACEVICERIKC